MTTTITADEARALLGAYPVRPNVAFEDTPEGVEVRLNGAPISEVDDDEWNPIYILPGEGALLAAAPNLAAAVIAQAADVARATAVRDDAAQALDALVARVWRAATGDTHEGPASVDALIAAVEGLRRERDEARAIVEGRTVPPTDEEIAVHARSGGTWRFLGLRGFALSGDVVPAEDAIIPRALYLRTGITRRWWALDAEGRPCAWPVVGGAR